MPKGYPRSTCKVCNAPCSEVGPLSARGKCGECAEALERLNYQDLRRHGGPFFEHWRRRSLAALGVFVHDEAR